MSSASNSSFLKELKALNQAQTEAVNAIEGPVLVIAGPGTGKTQILAARIGNILLKTDAKAHNILCLTYTDAGTIAMRKRLLQFIGPEAYRVHIHTFHSFCNLVIQENLDYFGLRSLEPVSDLEQIEILHEIIDEFEPESQMKRYKGDVYYDTQNLKNLFQLMKKEDWTPEFIVSKANEYVKELPFLDAFIYKRGNSKTGVKVGDLKQKDIDAETSRMKKLKEAATAFQSYQEKLKQRHRYDYADMILWVLDAFRKDEDLLRNYQERYLYYLVDEFQDTSGAQSELLSKLIDYWDQPNVFVVGDDDQSIYAFQDANVKNILHFAQKYSSGLKRVMMTENYRSTQSILDLSGALIDQNQDRLTKQIAGLEKKLRASHPERIQDEALPSIRTYYNSFHETVHVAHQIKALHEDGVPLSEIAVIYRKHSQAEDISRYLQVLGIPLNIKKELNVLEQPLVHQMLQILRYIRMELEQANSGEPLLFPILHYRFFGLAPIDIAKMSVEVSSKNYRERKTSFRQEMAKQSSKNLNLFEQDKDPLPFKRVSSDIEYWISHAHDFTLQQLLEKIINRGGILRMALSSSDKTWLMQLIHSFFEFVKDECARDTRMGLTEFLDKVDLMLENRLEVPVQRVTYSVDGVNFLTAHSSKGLEFDYVFLIGCDARSWKARGRDFDFKLPESLAPKTEVNEDEESRRLFYVAMTRAKRHLNISWAERNAADKEMEKSAFVAEAEAAGIAQNEYIALPDEDLFEFQSTVLQELHMPEVHLIDTDYLKDLLFKYSMSVTHLNNYLKCPLSFYFDNLLRVPRAKSASMTFGSAVHFALERMFKKMLEDPDKQFRGIPDLINDFEWYMQRNRDSFTAKDFELKSEYGRLILPQYFEKYHRDWNRVVVAEKNFRNIEVQGVTINGKIDKIEFVGKDANLIDYKTGKYENAKPKLKAPNPDIDPEKKKFEDEFGGDYWRQAVFYKILMNNDPSHDWNMVSSEFDFVEPDKTTGEFHKEKIYIRPEDETLVTRQITDSYARIMQHDFQGCGKEECGWCNFVKNHYRLETELGIPTESEE
ncbi:MAG: AAA family ATPase [Bacteroidetes bacterium]|nr:AAA family ATPase [Bacteroidota bacterium]